MDTQSANEIYLKWDSMMEIANNVCNESSTLASINKNFTPYEYLILYMLFINIYESMDRISINGLNDDDKNVFKNQKKYIINENKKYILDILNTKFNDEANKYALMQSRLVEENAIYLCILKQKKDV
jgi:hypothetical protein